MKIEIDVDTKADEKIVLYNIKQFCYEHFQNCKISIDGKLKAEVKWDK